MRYNLAGQLRSSIGVVKTFTRREFLGVAGMAAAGVACSPRNLPHTPDWMTGRTTTTILFQGDSITDTGRNRTVTAANSASALGTGYPLLVASAILKTNAGRGLRFYNRGLSG